MANKTKSLDPFIINTTLQIVLTLVVSACVVTLYDHYRYRPVFTVDVETIMSEKMKEVKFTTMTGKEDSNQLVEMSKRWAKELENEVLTLAREHNAIILARPAVVEGSIDMTQHIMSRIIRRDRQ